MLRSGGGFQNPMLSPGDLIVGGISGLAQRLPMGGVGTSLTVGASGLTWGAGGGGTPVLPVNNQTVAAYTLAATDAPAANGYQGIVTMNNAGANLLTVPPNSSVAFLIGTQIRVIQLGAGQTAIAAGSGVSFIVAGSVGARTQNSALTLLQVATNTWEVFGDSAGAAFNGAQSTFPLPASTGFAGAYDLGQYVLFGGNSEIYSSNNLGVWTAQTNPLTSAVMQQAAAGNGVFMGINWGTTNTNVVYGSPTGTWATYSAGGIANGSIAFGNGVFVVLGDSTTAVSATGASWASGSMPGAGYYAVAFGNGVFAAVANGTNQAAWSTNGTSWTAVTLPFNTYWRSITFNGVAFVAAAYLNNQTAFSLDGKTWFAGSNYSGPSVTVPGNMIGIGGVTYVAGAGTLRISRDNGINWQNINAPISLSNNLLFAGQNQIIIPESAGTGVIIQ